MKRIFFSLFGLTLFASASFGQNVTVTGSTGANSTYATLKAAFDALNANTNQTGNTITVSVVGNTTETLSAVLNQPSGGSWSTLTISPSGTRSISGAIAGHLIDLNGADNVTISGLGTLTIENTSTSASATTIRFIADARNNTVQNCNIKGSGTGAALGTIFFSTGTTTGNDGNIITSNSITSSGATFPTNAIYSAGTSVAIDNSGITISVNNISDYFNAGAASNGIFVASNSSGWTITDNKFFQTGTRTPTAGSLHTAIQILTASGGGYTVNNNTIGFASAAGTGSSTYAGGQASRYSAMELTVAASPVSNVQGNTINGFSFATTSGVATVGSGIFQGITVRGGGVNIGTVTGNTIGATSGTGAINITSTTSLGYIAGIYATSTGTVSIQNNNVGSLNTGGAATIGYTFAGIQTAGTAGNFTISANTIGSTATANSIAIGTSGTTTAVTAFQGIVNGATGTNSITGNTIQNCSAFTSGAGVWSGIVNTAGTGTLNITTNNIISGTLSGTGAFTAISNSAAPATVNINTNVIRSNAKSAATGTFTGITSSGAVTTALNINSNQMGNGSGGLITYSAANSGALTGISATAVAAAATLSISSNDFQGIVHSVAGSSVHTYITWSHASSVTDNINNNTFTNLNVNTSGDVTFLTRTGNITATGSENVNSNAIVTAFGKGASGGTVTFFDTNGASVNGSTMTNNLNNFSNVTVKGRRIIAGWNNVEGASAASGPTKTITNNTFDNITANTTPTGAITGMTVDFSGAGTSVASNTISNITGGAAITGLVLGTSNQSITASSNVIDPITSSGASAVTAISSGAPTVTISKNKIYDLSGTVAGTWSMAFLFRPARQLLSLTT